MPSSILRLPPEIRTKIYNYVLGSQRIYPNNHYYEMNSLSKPFRRCFVCRCENHVLEIHQACDLDQLHLDLLVTCRQIHSEVFPLFWSSNLFCLQDRLILSSFIKHLRPYQRRLIRRLRLYMENYLGTPTLFWDPAATNAIWDTLSNVRHLQLIIAYYKSPYRSGPSERHRESHLSDFILKLSTSPLQSVEVRIGAASLDEHTFNETHDPAEGLSTEVCAERIQKMLLDKIYARSQCTMQKLLDEAWTRQYTKNAHQKGLSGIRQGLQSNPYR